jgi:hypothetical protein
MRHIDGSSLASAAEWLSARTCERWTPALLIERLIELGPDRLYVSLPPGWALVETGSGASVRFPHRVALQVCMAVDFLEQFAMFGDLSIAVGVPQRLIADNDAESYRSVGPIPAAMIRLQPEHLRALASLAGHPAIVPFLDLVAEMRANLRSRRS